MTAGADSFVEKLAANVIKNLQVHITDIHMRYEDAFTNPSKPFSVGVTLKELRFEVGRSNLSDILCGAKSPTLVVELNLFLHF